MRRALAAEGVSCCASERMRRESQGVRLNRENLSQSPQLLYNLRTFLGHRCGLVKWAVFRSRYKPGRAMGFATRAQIS